MSKRPTTRFGELIASGTLVEYEQLEGLEQEECLCYIDRLHMLIEKLANSLDEEEKRYAEMAATAGKFVGETG